MGEQVLYCEKCDKMITDPARNYKLTTICQNIHTDQLDKITIFDEAAEGLMGCRPDVFAKVGGSLWVYTEGELTCLNRKWKKINICHVCWRH